MFSMLLASKYVILHSWSSPGVSVVITEALPIASGRSGYENSILVSDLVSLTLYR